jgi:hypothetical protein
MFPPWPLLFHAMRGMHLHAERHLAKAGGSNCKPRGIPILAMERKRNGKGVAQRRSAQAKRGRLGSGLRGAGGAGPPSVLGCCLFLPEGVAGG